MKVALVGKLLTAKAGDTRDAGSIPGWGRSPEGWNGKALRYSCLEHPMDRRLAVTVHGVTESDTTEVTYHAHTCIRKIWLGNKL